MGTVLDIELDDKFNLEKFYLNNENIIEQKQLINLGKSIILTNELKFNTT